MRPRPLNLHPDADHLVGCRQLLLPGGDLGEEVGDVFGGQHVLQLYLWQKITFVSEMGRKIVCFVVLLSRFQCFVVFFQYDLSSY